MEAREGVTKKVKGEENLGVKKKSGMCKKRSSKIFGKLSKKSWVDGKKCQKLYI